MYYHLTYRVKRLPHITFLFLWLLLFPLSLLAIEVIDIDTFNFPHSGTKGVRIVRFDADGQKFTGLDYYIQPTASQFEINYRGLVIDNNCKVTVSVKFKLNDIIIRTTGEIGLNKTGQKFPKDWHCEEATDYTDKGGEVTRTVLSYNKIDIEKGSTVMNKLNQKSGKTTGAKNFKAVFHKSKTEEKKAFGLLTADTTDNKRERGVLGELATHLTMLRFGYGCHYSKYGTNHGFDGIYQDESDNPELFITESKCKDRADDVKTILRDDLSEATITSKLNHIFNDDHNALSSDAKDLLQATGQIVEDYISESPAAIFKFAHRVKQDGSCQCLVEKFNVKNYRAKQASILTPTSPDQDKAAAVKDLMDQLCKADQEKANLALKSFNGSDREKLTLVLTAMGINKKQQAAALKELTFKGEKVKKVLKYDDDDEESADQDKAN